jgi:hypothetical protein
MLLGMRGHTMRTMRLAGANGDQVELHIVGYQFPDTAGEQWDSNWLNITITATVDHRSWTSHDPSLLTMDKAALEAESSGTCTRLRCNSLGDANRAQASRSRPPQSVG